MEEEVKGFYMVCLLKYENPIYTIETNETSNQCVIFKRGSSLSPSKGFVINAPQLHVPFSCDIFDMYTKLNVYKVDVHKTLKLDQLYKILKFDAEVVSIPFVCKKHFSKKFLTEYVKSNSKFYKLYKTCFDTG